MGRAPLPLGTWGKIRVYPYHYDAKGKPDTFRAETLYRDFDGRTRPVTAYGRSWKLAANKLRERVKERTETDVGANSRRCIGSQLPPISGWRSSAVHGR